MFERMSDTARRAVVRAFEAVTSTPRQDIGGLAILLGALTCGDGGVAELALERGLSPAVAADALGPKRTRQVSSGHVPFTTSAKEALVAAVRAADETGSELAGAAHLVVGILDVNELEVGRLLDALRIDRPELRAALLASVGSLAAGTDRSAAVRRGSSGASVPFFCAEVGRAQDRAVRSGTVDAVPLAYELVADPEGSVSAALTAAGLDVDAIRRALATPVEQPVGPEDSGSVAGDGRDPGESDSES